MERDIQTEKSIREEWYEEMKERIKEKEWKETLRELKTGTAPSISDISYILIKRAGVKTQEIFKSFADLCLEKEEIPVKWKIAQVYLIPKDIEW